MADEQIDQPASQLQTSNPFPPPPDLLFTADSFIDPFMAVAPPLLTAQEQEYFNFFLNSLESGGDALSCDAFPCPSTIGGPIDYSLQSSYSNSSSVMDNKLPNHPNISPPMIEIVPHLTPDTLQKTQEPEHCRLIHGCLSNQPTASNLPNLGSSNHDRMQQLYAITKTGLVPIQMPASAFAAAVTYGYRQAPKIPSGNDTPSTPSYKSAARVSHQTSSHTIENVVAPSDLTPLTSLLRPCSIQGPAVLQFLASSSNELSASLTGYQGSPHSTEAKKRKIPDDSPLDSGSRRSGHHQESEKKRRTAIRQGYSRLVSVIPALRETANRMLKPVQPPFLANDDQEQNIHGGHTVSKATILVKSSEYISCLLRKLAKYQNSITELEQKALSAGLKIPPLPSQA